MSRALDALVAEKVMGWRADWECKICGSRPDPSGEVWHGRGCYEVNENGGGVEMIDVEVPAYSADLAAAWTVVEQLSPEYYVTLFGGACAWHAKFCRTAEGVSLEEDIFAETAPLAICRAALKAVGVEVPT